MIPELRNARHKTLPRETEYELVRRAQSGDRKAMDVLVRNNMPGIFSIVGHVCCGHQQLQEDAANEGIIALMRAIQMFDETEEVRLWTYAQYRVKADVNRWLSKNRSQVSAQRLNAIRYKILEAEQRGESIAKLLDTTEERAEEVRAFCLGWERSLDKPCGDSSDAQWELEDPHQSVHGVANNNEATALLSQAIADALDDREKTIVLERSKGDSLQQVGDRQRVSRERIRQVEERAVQKLKRWMLRRGIQREDIFA